MNKKVLIAAIPILILIGISAVLGIYVFKETEDLSVYFKGDEQPALLEQVDSQKEVNEKLESIANSSKYTLQDAYVELNPYGISPLSAIIIFQTKEEETVEVHINGDLATTMEPSKKHTIPIYGLFEDYENKIELVTDDESKEYIIKTEKSNVNYPLEVLEKKTVNNSNIYFTVASYETYLTGWDTDGNLRFYLTVDNRMDVEWLDNGHFLIGTSQGQVRENFLAVAEMDYLGKIYNYYTLEHGYGFEMQVLDNGNYMLAGGDVPIHFNHQYIYEIDSEGKEVSGIDLYEVIKAIDSEFPDVYLGPKAIRNGFYYNKETEELVVSFREINTIFNFDYKNKKLNYVFTNEGNTLFTSPVWEEYLVEVETGRYPLGQHTPTITKEGYLALFNNGYDRYGIAFNNLSDKVENFKDEYTSMEIYDIKDNKANLVWSYDFDKKYFSIKYGIFTIYDDGSKLMNYGYVLKDEFRNRTGESLVEVEKGIDDIYTLITEIDENDNVVFQAKSAEGKYRAFRHTLYNEKTSNVSVKQLNLYNTIPEDKLDRLTYKEANIKDSQEWIYSVDYTKNTFTTNYQIQESDEIKLYYMNETGNVFSLTYKEKDNTTLNRIFNANLPSDKYALFINVNGITYNTNIVINY